METKVRGRLSSRIAIIGFLLVMAFFLFGEHRAHLLGILPYLLLLLCPLFHLLLHRGHGDSGSHGHEPPVKESKDEP